MNGPRLPAQLSILVLLILSVCINYLDRGSLSVAAPVMEKEFALTPSQLGWLFSAFFWSYAIFQLVAGWLVDRYDVKWVYAGGFLLWSLATAATGMLTAFSALLIARLFLGVGESVTYPAISRIVVKNFPERQRGTVNSLIDAGCKIGPALSTLLGGLLVDRFGWRALFFVMGLGGLLWLLPWMMLVPADKGGRGTQESHGPSMWDIIRRREALGTSLGMFTLGYVWYFLLSWLPLYLVQERGFSMAKMAVMGSLPFWAMAVATASAGWASDQWIKRGGSVTRVRKTFVIGGLLLCAALMMPAVFVKDASLCIGLLVGASAALGIFTSNVWAVTQTLAGPLAAGRWSGIQNCVGNFGGVASSVMTGFIVQLTGSFFAAFAVASAMFVAGAVAYAWLVREVAPLDWDQGKKLQPIS